MINHFNRLINGVSYGARHANTFQRVKKKIYKGEGVVKY
ncbi:hypothetical protein AQU20_14670 [Escherichia albertii]|nr:hypothetical protein AQU20_14670 [Escherichia albertii]PFF97201.1 hypothetical protein CRH02_05780 [Escherichia albertii]